jgi:predicted RNA-binding protein (TIGR00451 family)
MQPPTPLQLRKIIGIANYQFGEHAGSLLFDRKIRIVCSKRTGRIRHIYRDGMLMATLRPKDGYLALTPHGARLVLSKLERAPNLVIVQKDVSEFIRAGGDVFAKHVTRADTHIRPAEEVIVTDEDGLLLGVGRSILSGEDMKHFRRGVAVRIRRGVDEPRNPSN